MKNIQIKLFAGAAVMLVLAVACAKVAENDWEEAGEIRFSASAQAPEVEFPATKTAYGAPSGSIKILTWSENDQISIYAPNEFNYYAEEATIPAVSYSIAGHTESGTTSTATGVTAVTPNTALQWGSATGAGSHKFYGRYPDPTWNTGANTPYADSELFKNQELKSAYFTCYLPAMQPFSRTGFVCAPTMQYLYMTAYAAVDRNATVALNFKPAVSAFNIKFKNQYVGESFIVKSVELVSESKYLTGSYSMDIAAGAITSTSLVSGSDADKRAGVDFGVGLELTKDTYLDVTIFTRPVEFNDLSIVITTTNGDVQKLELKDDLYAYLSFPAGKYFEITCGDVPDPFVYTLDIAGGDVVAATGEGAGTVSNPYTLEIDCQGVAKSTTFSLVSMKEKLGLITATPWEVEYTDDPSDPESWSTTSPVTGFSATAPAYTGSTSGETVTVTMPAGTGDSYIGVIPNEHTFSSTNGGSSGTPLDLSYYDGVTDTVYDTEDHTKQETANCYIVRGAGWYSFPLVYGNGIKGGVANTSAYHLTSDGSKRELVDFVKADGDPIFDTGTVADVQISGATAVDLLWQDSMDNVITNIQLVDSDHNGANDKVVFQVQNPITPLNAVIQVKNAGGTVLWSWHIWLVGDEQNLAKVNVTNHSGRNFNMLSAHLGQIPSPTVSARGYPSEEVYVRFTTTADPNPLKAKSLVLKVTRPHHMGSFTPYGYTQNPTYQWGRKDPMLTAAGYTLYAERIKDDTRLGYGYKGSMSAPPSTSPQNATTIENTIKNPGIFYTHKSGVSNTAWFTTLYMNLWDTALNSDTTIADDNASTKSVYDPCPRGYKVSRKYDFTGFTSSGDNAGDKNVIGSYNRGYVFQLYDGDTVGNYFADTPYREPKDGTIHTSGIAVCICASSITTYCYVPYFAATTYYVHPLGEWEPACAWTIRPVEDN